MRVLGEALRGTHFEFEFEFGFENDPVGVYPKRKTPRLLAPGFYILTCLG